MSARLAARFTCYLCGAENVVTLNTSSRYYCRNCDSGFVLAMVPGVAFDDTNPFRHRLANRKAS